MREGWVPVRGPFDERMLIAAVSPDRVEKLLTKFGMVSTFSRCVFGDCSLRNFNLHPQVMALPSAAQSSFYYKNQIVEAD